MRQRIHRAASEIARAEPTGIVLGQRRPALGQLQDDSAAATAIDINTSGFAGFFIVRLPNWTAPRRNEILWFVGKISRNALDVTIHFKCVERHDADFFEIFSHAIILF